MKKRIRILVLAGLVTMSSLVAIPALAIEDCNKYENAFERAGCIAMTVIELAIQQWWNSL